MGNIAIEMSEDEVQHVWQTYQTLQRVIEKVISPNELYHTEFLNGLQESISDVHNRQIKEVKTFEDFIA